ncbi:BON domain-containing protein [Streptomyces sioyaensis]|uniref:BON domain-containing protein n=1 Tax=Streptomyces sioyaensis TaxID=67364 RepID=UPI00371AF470
MAHTPRTVGDVMTQTVVATGQAARTMAYKSVKRLPVVDGGGLLQGIVSRSDLLKVFLRSDEDLAAEVRTEVVGRLFADSAPELSVRVTDGVVTLSGRIRNTSLIPVAARLVRAVEGVVDVTFDLEGPAPEQGEPPVAGRSSGRP